MKIRIVIVILLFLMALVLLIAAFFYYFQGQKVPLINKVVTLPIIEDPADYVLRQALDNVKSVSTASYDLNVKGNWSAYGTDFSLDSDILFDGRFEDKPQGKIKISNEMSIQNLSFLATLDASLSQDKIYFQVSEVPALPFLDMKEIDNKWYEADWRLTDFTNFTNFYEIAEEFIILYERIPDEVVDGQISYHYKFIIDGNNPNFKSLISGNDLVQDLFKKDNLDQIILEVWVSKSDHYLKKATTNFSNETLTLSLDLQVADYNQPVSLEKPERGNSLNQMSIDLFKSTNILEVTIFGYLVGIEDDYLTEDNDDDGLYRVWEDLLGTNDDLSDTDADGYSDIDELKNGYNPSGSGQLFD